MNIRIFCNVAVLAIVASLCSLIVSGIQDVTQDNGLTSSAKSPVQAVSNSRQINQLLSEGVTPENNAIVEILNALGPRPIPNSISDEFHAWLQIDALPADGDYFIPLHVFAEQNFGKQKEGNFYQDELYRKFESIYSHPWNADENPFWNNWIDRNEPALRHAAAAATKDRSYHPLVSGKPNIVIASMLPLVGETRNLSRCLLARSMRELANDNVSAAIDDLKTVRRMAHLNTHSLTVVEYLVSLAIETMALDAESQLLGSGKLTARQCSDYQRFIANLKPKFDIARRLDVWERLAFVDLVQKIDELGARGVADALELESADQLFAFFVQPESQWPMFEYFAYTVDWERAKNVGTDWFDRAVAAWREPDDVKRIEQIEKFSKQFDDHLENIEATRFGVWHVIGMLTSARTRGQFVGNFMIGMFIPNQLSIGYGEIRLKVQNDLVQLGFAIEQFRLKNDRLPKQLSELVPSFIDRPPIDRFNNQPLIYRPGDGGYLLYSVGADTRDNKGRRRSDPVDAELAKTDLKLANGDDVVLRVEYADQ